MLWSATPIESCVTGRAVRNCSTRPTRGKSSHERPIWGKSIAEAHELPQVGQLGDARRYLSFS
jgi:hypothetical protein